LEFEMTNTKSTTRLPLADLFVLSEWQTLSGKQQVFLSRYISSGMNTGTYDSLAAVQFAYGVSVKNAPGLASRLLAHKKIRRILALHFGQTAHDDFESILPMLAKAIKRSIKADLKAGGAISPSTVETLKLYERHAGSLQVED